MKSAAEGFDTIFRNRPYDRPARGDERAEVQSKNRPFVFCEQFQHEGGHEKCGGDRNGENLFEPALLFAGGVAVYDFHLFEVGYGIQGFVQSLLRGIGKIHPLSHKVDGDLLQPFDFFEFLLQFRRAPRAVEICNPNDFFHIRSLKFTVEMGAGEFQKGDDVLVGKRVDDVLPVPPRLDDAVVPQNTELMGYAALRSPHRLQNVIDAHLPLPQRKQNFQSARLGKCLKFRTHVRDLPVRRQICLCPRRRKTVFFFVIAIFHTLFLFRRRIAPPN